MTIVPALDLFGLAGPTPNPARGHASHELLERQRQFEEEAAR